MLLGLLTVLAPYVALMASWYVFVMYPVVYFRRHYRIVRRPVHA